MKNELYTTLETQGNISVITQMTNVNKRGRVKRISKTEYVDIATGEVREYKNHATTRAGNKKSLLRTFATIRGLINANATDPEKVKFLTLTYAENMTDPKRLYRDFKSFWQRLLYWHDKEGYERPLYLLVVEPQARGAWHGHLLLFYEKEERAPFIPKEDLKEKIWRHGFVSVRDVERVDNLGAYLSAYLSSIAIDADEGNENAVEIDGQKKAIIKGSRLSLYPPSMKIYRASRSLKRPQKRQISSQEAEEHRREHNPTYATTRTIKDPETGFETTVHKEWFNDARKP